MTSIERREGRFQRRKAKRLAKKEEKLRVFDEVMSWRHLINASHKCVLGVKWKASTQYHNAYELLIVARQKKALKTDTYKALPFMKFAKYDHGKVRNITSCHIKDRVVQKALVDNCLLPILVPKLIYDNGACLKYKGITFSRRRIKLHLKRAIKEYGNFYVLQFDYKSYFASINHKILLDKVSEAIKDKRLVALYAQLLHDFEGDCGIGLGSQISQISAIYYLNKVDHLIKEKLGIKEFGRYMDDGYIIHPDKKYLSKCKDIIEKELEKIGVRFNNKKTQIVKITKGINFLKRKYQIQNNEPLVRPCRKTIVHERRRLNRMIKNEKFTRDTIIASEESWESCLIGTKAYKQKMSMREILKKGDLCYG